MSHLSTLGVAICVPLVVIFGIIALLNTRHIYKDDSIIFYLTARNTFGARMITLSFFGVTVGTCLFLLPSVLIADPIQGSGWIGLASYSLSHFGATFMIAWLGSIIKEKYPDIISIGDYAKIRFGYSSQILITGVAFGNMILAMAEDYTAIGIIFSQILDIQPLFPILTVGIVTSIYTSIGGVYVSIWAHQYQLIFASLLLVITVTYLGINFDWDSLGELPPHLRGNANGARSLITHTISVFSSLFFSDAMWQRVWAAKDTDALRKGGLYGGILSGIFVFVFGFFAFLSSWSGYQGSSKNAIFNILNSGNGAPYWIIIILAMLAIVMNETTIDSVQNALANSLISLAISFGVKLSLNWTRIVVFAINILIIFIGIQGLDIVSLALFSDMMTSFAMAPILLSMFACFDNYIKQPSLIFCYVFSMIGLFLYGYFCTGSIFHGVYTFVYLSYDAGAFAVVFFGPVLGLIVWNIFERFLMSTKFGRHKLIKMASIEQKTSEGLFSDFEYV